MEDKERTRERMLEFHKDFEAALERIQALREVRARQKPFTVWWETNRWRITGKELPGGPSEEERWAR